MDRRRDSDPVLMWLWHRPQPQLHFEPLAWEPPYATSGPKKKKKKKKILFHPKPLIGGFFNLYYFEGLFAFFISQHILTVTPK